MAPSKFTDFTQLKVKLIRIYKRKFALIRYNKLHGSVKKYAVEPHIRTI